jgi:hypothetical protein
MIFLLGLRRCNLKRTLQLLLSLLFVLLPLHCSDIYDPSICHIIVFVHGGSDDFPVGGIKVELVERGEVRRTSEKGLAEFQVNPGNYTIRVYDLESPGPRALRTEEFLVEVREGEDRMIKVFDCVGCD